MTELFPVGSRYDDPIHKYRCKKGHDFVTERGAVKLCLSCGAKVEKIWSGPQSEWWVATQTVSTLAL